MIRTLGGVKMEYNFRYNNIGGETTQDKGFFFVFAHFERNFVIY